MVAGGCIISGATVRESLLFSDVRVDERSLVHASVVLPSVRIGKGCQIKRAILDEGCVVPDGMEIGIDQEADVARFEVTEKGVVLVTPQMLKALA
jgi:glucose-1-phosphate adenylyltransferase